MLDVEVLEVKGVELQFEEVDGGSGDVDGEVDVEGVEDCGLPGEDVDGVEAEGVCAFVLIYAVDVIVFCCPTAWTAHAAPC